MISKFKFITDKIISESHTSKMPEVLDISIGKILDLLEKDNNRRDLYMELEAWIQDNMQHIIDDPNTFDTLDATGRTVTYDSGQ